MIILAPSNIWPEDMPTRIDEWFLKIKKDVVDRYQVSPRKIYLVGKEGGAHYAAYLGTKYPNEFSAVALLGGSWAGKFEKIIEPQSRPRRQLPFFVALKDPDPDLLTETQQKASQFEKKGYPVYLVQLGKDEEFDSDPFKQKLLDWFDEKSAKWHERVEESKKSWKEKTSMAVEEFFHA